LVELTHIKEDISEIKKQLDWTEDISLGQQINYYLSNIDLSLDLIQVDTSSIDSNTSDL
jgi:hypothetical protein